MVNGILSHARVSDERFQAPEVQTLDELERTLLALSSAQEIEKVPTQSAGIRALGFNYDSFLELAVEAALRNYVCCKLRLSSEKGSQPSLKKLLPVAMNMDWSAKSAARSESMVRLLVNELEAQRTEEWTIVEVPSLWIFFLRTLPEEYGIFEQWDLGAYLQTIQMFLDMGANSKEQHDGCVAWESTLQKLEDQFKQGRFQVSRNEAMDFIEKYRIIFLAHDVELSSAQPSVDLNAGENAGDMILSFNQD